MVKEGDTPPAPITVRVCDSLSCEMAGAKQLLEELPRKLGRTCACARALRRPLRARAGGRDRPVAAHATRRREKAAAAVKAQAARACLDTERDFAAYRRAGGYALLQDCLGGKRDAR